MLCLDSKISDGKIKSEGDQFPTRLCLDSKISDGKMAKSISL